MASGRRFALLNVCGLVVVLVLLVAAVPAGADPCLVVYPDGVCSYHYDVNEYYTVTVGDPLYDPMYDRNGEVLIEVGTNTIDFSIYQAPGLAGFEPSTNGEDGYFMIGTDFNLIVDGWSNVPTNYVNILLVFDPDPSFCLPVITVDGDPVLFDTGLGQYYPVGDLVVSTPTSEGNNYSDTMSFGIHWEGCSGVRVWAFSDADFNLVNDGGECFSAFSHDLTVPVEESTWGHIKSLYGGR